MAILSKGTDFSTGDQVTAAKLDALVDNATFASDAVDDSTTALDSNGKIIVKDGGITSAKLNLSATGASQVIASFKAVQDGNTRSLAINTPASTTDLSSPFEFETGNAIKFQIDTLNPVVIDASARVGIGTDSPSKLLHVKSPNSDTAEAVATFGNGDIDSGLQIKTNGNGGSSLDWGFNAVNSRNMVFDTNQTERMRITSSGIVMVGRTLGSSADNDSGIVLSPSGFIYLARDGTGAQTHLQFINNAASSATTVGTINTNGSATSYNTSSDYRLKEDIVEMQDSIERVKALKPVNFAWKLDGTRVDGFLAHEAQEVVPAAVTGTKDAVDEDGQPDYQGIDQSKLVPLLTKALQEALTKIESLEARVAALES